MKNNSVKFKHNLPKSSTTSVISQFSFEASPMPNAFQFQNFTHAQSISARLTKNSVYNNQNIIFNTPRCMNVPYSEIMKDDVLAKSPLSRMSQTQKWNMKVEPITFTDAVIKELKYTEHSLKKIQKLERFLDDQKSKRQKTINILSSEETPKKNTLQKIELEQNFEIDPILSNTNIDPKINKKFNLLMDDLRIIRKNIQYFTPFDGLFAQTHFDLYNYVPLKTSNGCLINNGNSLTKIQLIGDTFKLDKICDNPERNSSFLSYCVSDSNLSEDLIIAGTQNGQLLSWNPYKNAHYEYYGLNQELYGQLNSTVKPTFITQHLQNLFVGTQDNQLLLLDHRLKEKNCLSFSKTQSKLFRADSVQQSPLLPRFGQQFSMDSPQINAIDINELNETNFNLDEMETENQLIQLQIPTFKQIERQGIQFIDVRDFDVIVTMPTGFIHFDIRNPFQEQFSHLVEDANSIRAQFTPNSVDNIIYADENSNKCSVWNVQKNELLFEKELPSNPSDIIVSPITKEILTVHNEGQHSKIRIFNNSHSKLKYTDEIEVPNFQIKKIMLDQQCECLYGIGAYSLRTWNFYQQKEIKLIQEEMKNQLEMLF